MTKEYKIEPPEIVRQMLEAGLRVMAYDARGALWDLRQEDSLPSCINEATVKFYPPSWIKELEPERIPADRVKEGAPVEVRDEDNEDDIWGLRKMAGSFKGRALCYDNVSNGNVLSWDYWRIPTNMDPEEWKREWLIPEEELPEVVNPWPKKDPCPNCDDDGLNCPYCGCNGTGEVDHD